jgi:apolipoprotein N-acyltransferase
MRGYVHLIVSITIIITAVAFGFQNLKKNPTIFSDLTVRIVQPSIPQTAKWDVKEFWKNFNLHLELSNQPAKVDFIIWSEAAMTVPYYYPVIKDKMVELLQKTDAILITGGVSDNGKKEDEFEIYSSIYAMDKHGDIIFNYHKAHLVPFGEYMPFKAVLPVKKLTHGFLDYTEGKQALVEIKKAHIKIRPLICYEAIFPEEVRVSNQLVDLLVNITNDAWYGRSSGPYQHYYLSLMRAIENGLPLIRVANNGLSAVIDPQGRVLKKLNLNQVAYADEKIPLKSPSPTLYSEFGYLMTVILAIITLLLHLLINFSLKNYPFIYKNS